MYLKGKCVAAEQSWRSRSSPISRFGRVLEGQYLESKAWLAARHDEEIAVACSKMTKRRTPTNPEGGAGQLTATPLANT